MEKTPKQEAQDITEMATALGLFPEEVIEREVKQFGSGSAHCLIPKKHIGKTAKVFIYPKKEEGKKV